MSANSKITLYTGQSPNGIKISILLEELGLPYEVRRVNIKDNEQKAEWFLKINPNGRIPAITDTLPDGSEVRVFESGSIMQYLVDRYDAQLRVSYPRGSREHIETTSWLFFQNAGIGPMQGQANHFGRYAAEEIPYAINRYVTETKRLYFVLEQRFKETGSPYLVGDKCTIADIAHWGWISLALWAGLDISDFPLLKEWDARMLARPAVERGRHVPDRDLREILSDPVMMEDIQKRGKAMNAVQAARDREEVKARTEATNSEKA